jgi:trimethylamine:corrinoid methyltransferase-like protein
MSPEPGSAHQQPPLPQPTRAGGQAAGLAGAVLRQVDEQRPGHCQVMGERRSSAALHHPRPQVGHPSTARGLPK